MIHVSRGAYTELPDGSITCTITIPAHERAYVLDGAEITLPSLPGHPPGVVHAPIKVPGDLLDAMSYVVPLPHSASPPAQTIGAAGTEPPEIMPAEAQQAWQHPAARHIATLYQWEPFQRFAAQIVKPDAFAAPMPTAMSLLRKTARTKLDNPIEPLEALMTEFVSWCKTNSLVPWPDRVD